MKHWDDCTPAQQIERWENVVRVLNGLSPHERQKHWDMANFGVATDCGTVACAAGHCGLDPWFRRRGFTLLPVSMPNPWSKGVGEFRGFEGTLFLKSGARACKTFFGESGSNSIFFNDTHRPVSQVIREVRAYIKKLRKAPVTP